MFFRARMTRQASSSSSSSWLLLLLLLLLVFIVSTATAADFRRASRQTTFPAEFNPAKVDTFLKNDDFVRSQINCVLANDETRCSPIGRRIRKFIIDGLAANGQCPGQCTQEERESIAKVLKHVKSRFNGEWNQIATKYNVPPEILTRLEAL